MVETRIIPPALYDLAKSQTDAAGGVGHGMVWEDNGKPCCIVGILAAGAGYTPSEAPTTVDACRAEGVEKLLNSIGYAVAMDPNDWSPIVLLSDEVVRNWMNAQPDHAEALDFRMPFDLWATAMGWVRGEG
jgi:hypothetical protein